MVSASDPATARGSEEHAEVPPPSLVGSSRLLSTLILLLGLGVFLALPFVLQAGSVIFLPCTVAFVLTIALSPIADWLGRFPIPSGLASFAVLIAVFFILAAAIFLVVEPAADLAGELPAAANRIAARLEIISGNFRQLEALVERLGHFGSSGRAQEVVVAGPSLVEQLIYATPTAVLKILLAILLTFFMMEARLRAKRKLLLDRAEYRNSLRAARVFNEVQTQVSAYFAATLAIACTMGFLVGLGAMAYGWESPVMWGGLAAVLNLIPYLGPLTMMTILAVFGLGSEASIGAAIAPALSYLGLNAVEANVATPAILGKRLSLSPVAVLIAISYFGWIWGMVGVLVSVPLLVILTALFHHLGTPNIVGFMFGEPLIRAPESDVTLD